MPKKFYFSGLQTYKSSRRPTLAILINSFILDAGALGFVLSLASMIQEKKKRLVIMHVIKKRNRFAFGREEGLRSGGARQHLSGEEWREDRCWIPRQAGGTWNTDLKEKRSLGKILREFIMEYLILNLSSLYLMKLPVNSTFLFTPICNKYVQEVGRENWEEHSLRFMTVIQESLQCLFIP